MSDNRNATFYLKLMDRTNLSSTTLSLNVVRLRLGGKLGR